MWGAFCSWVIATPWMVWTLVAIDLGGGLAGYIWWYGGDIVAAPLWKLPFVPDSPLSVTLAAIALVAFHRGRRWNMLGLMAAFGLIKYGLWTDFVWFTNHLSSGAGYDLEAWALTLGHTGMALQGLVLLPLLDIRVRDALFVTAWYGLNDLLDYGRGGHPRVPNPWDAGAITAFAVSSTVVLSATFISIALARRRRAAAPVPRPGT